MFREVEKAITTDDIVTDGANLLLLSACDSPRNRGHHRCPEKPSRPHRTKHNIPLTLAPKLDEGEGWRCAEPPDPNSKWLPDLISATQSPSQ